MEDVAARIERLLDEVRKIIPAFTSARGTFSSHPERGYSAQNPDAWKRDFLEVFDGQYLNAFKPNVDSVDQLIRLLNIGTLLERAPITVPGLVGLSFLLPTSTLCTLLGYALIEMLIRKR